MSWKTKKQVTMQEVLQKLNIGVFPLQFVNLGGSLMSFKTCKFYAPYLNCCRLNAQTLRVEALCSSNPGREGQNRRFSMDVFVYFLPSCVRKFSNMSCII